MFRTEITIAPQARQLSRAARVLTVGSCFADALGERLGRYKVPVLANPFGTVFQPLALAQLLRAGAGEDVDWQQHVVEARGRWQSYDFHGSVGADSPVALLQQIQELVRRTGDFVREADAVLLTLGTAWAYRLRETGELVSNNHKMPAELFDKELLTADEVVNALAEVHAALRRHNPRLRIVLTVSPVRHLKDTLPLNAVSKSVLRVACHYLSELLPDVSYFPAYELLTDDLRDYRFYAADMLHPSEVAEDFVWEKFARAYFDADFGRFRKEWDAVRQALNHRPLHAGAPEHRQFLENTLDRLERLAAQGVDVRAELRDVQRRVAALPPPRPQPALATPEEDEERIDVGQTEATNASAPVESELSAPVPTTETAPEEPAEEPSSYPAKKKKRRSRGGAKRTARKHAAARLAAEQAVAETAANAGTDADPSLSEGTAAPLVDTTGADLVSAAPPEPKSTPEATPQAARGASRGSKRAKAAKSTSAKRGETRNRPQLFATPDSAPPASAPPVSEENQVPRSVAPAPAAESAPPAPRPKARRGRPKSAASEAPPVEFSAAVSAGEPASAATDSAPPTAKPKGRTRPPRPKANREVAASPAIEAQPADSGAPPAAPTAAPPKRRGRPPGTKKRVAADADTPA